MRVDAERSLIVNKDVYRQLSEKIDAEMKEYRDVLAESGAYRAIALSHKTALMEDIAYAFENCIRELSEENVEVLLKEDQLILNLHDRFTWDYCQYNDEIERLIQEMSKPPQEEREDMAGTLVLDGAKDLRAESKSESKDSGAGREDEAEEMENG
jgi:hypothetical protein